MLYDIPLKVLVIDADDFSANLLVQSLTSLPKELILLVERVSSLRAAQKTLEYNELDINAIYIDPLSFELEAASHFIFSIRDRMRSIVFVLYLDLEFSKRVGNFYAGERKRFSHFFKLDKLTRAILFKEELRGTIRQCQGDLSFSLTDAKIQKLREELASLRNNAPPEISEVITPLQEMIQDIQTQLKALREPQQVCTPGVTPRSVFLSYRFAEDEYVEGLRTLLQEAGFSVLTGQDAHASISRAILERIKVCEFFLCLMTRADEKKDGTFTTSSWLLEEKGAALALGKEIVLMVEEGIGEHDIGGLQGDLERIHFNSKNFTSKAIKARNQLKTYVGDQK